MEVVTRKELLQSALQHFKNGFDIFGRIYQSSIQQSAWQKTKIALINIERCLAWGGADCQFCYLVCPLKEKAIQIHNEKPVIIASGCDGCGVCQKACETITDMVAVSITGIRRS